MAVILCAEDDIQLQRLICMLLENDGFTVIAAGNGEFALEASRSHAGPVDLLLTDMEMPRMSGLELSGKIKVERPGIKILVMSGAMPANEPVSIEGLPFLSKPFTSASLRHSIQKLLDPLSSATPCANGG